MSTPIHYYEHKEVFSLESGNSLPGLTLAYHTYGQYREGQKVIWVCHALTGNADCQDWWPGLFEKGGLYDPEACFIICANMPGSCYGSTGPLSVNPETGQPWYHQFPQLSNRDIARAFDLLRRHLGIEQVHTLIGGSAGGQQALEWAILQPTVFEHLIAVCTNARHSAWGIAFNETQRMAIAADASWQSGGPEAGKAGLAAARAMALLSYRHYETYDLTQTDVDPDKREDYRAASYQRYQGEKLVRRFNAYSYWRLSQAMDSQHLGRGRGSIEEALQAISARTLVIGIPSDVLFPLAEQQYLVRHIPGAAFAVIPSDYGHDGFLIETEAIRKVISRFYEENSKSRESA